VPHPQRVLEQIESKQAIRSSNLSTAWPTKFSWLAPADAGVFFIVVLNSVYEARRGWREGVSSITRMTGCTYDFGHRASGDVGSPS